MVFLYEGLAILSLGLHVLFILFVILGAFLILKFKKIIFLHMPALIWGVYIEFSNRICPLTYLENYFLEKSGKDQYTVDFIEQYIIPMVYPPHLNVQLQSILGTILIIMNVFIYFYLFKKNKLLK